MERPTEPRAVLFTDLDGSFLDHATYRPGPAAAALRDLRAQGVMVVFCSAKTRAEQAHLQASLGFQAPFIVENGAAIADDGLTLAVFGLPHETVAERLRAAADEAGVRVRGYHEMTTAEISELTGLTIEAAERARAREFSVTFLIEGAGGGEGPLERPMGELGLRLVRGARFLSAQGDHDKGVAVRHLTGLLREGGGSPTIYGIGDYRNDLEMLAAVDVAMQVQQPDGSWADIPVDGIIRVDGIGPEGWAQAARRVIEELTV